MRKLYLPIVMTAALVVAGSTIALGQATGLTGTGPGLATITVVEMGPLSTSGLQPDAARDVYHEVGRTQTMTWVASDPRLSGEVESSIDRTMLRDGSVVERGTIELVNDDGRWVGGSFDVRGPAGVTGPIIGLPVPLPDPPQLVDTVLLEGEGDYQDLNVLASIDWRQDPPIINAVIFAGGPLADLPALAR